MRALLMAVGTRILTDLSEGEGRRRGNRFGAPLLRFAAVGALNTALDIVLFALLTGVGGLAAARANLLSYSCGICSSFALNRRWTFADRSTGHMLVRRFGLFALTNLLGLTLSTGLVIALAMVLPEFAAKVLSVPIVFAWNYLTSRLVVFR